MDIRITECPFCHASEFIEGKQESHGQLQSCESIWQSATLYHVICRRCGSVVRSYVKEPEKLLKRADRRERSE